MTRREELAAGLERVRARIATACERSARSPDEITLVVVTKFFPASDVDLLADLGVTDIGENRAQEAAHKVAELKHRERVSVHFIGQLQSNKAALVARYADVVQSVDRPKLVGALGRGLVAAGRSVDALVQVGLDHEPGRGGASTQGALEVADAIARSDRLHLRGVMAIAPLGADSAAAFARLREVAAGIQQHHAGADWISAGMSGDLEQAIEHGATHLRVGTAILGSRTSHR